MTNVKTHPSNPRLSMSSYEQYTAPYIIEPARECLGSIDLDPASSEAANAYVKATKYLTIEDDGLSQDWATYDHWGLINPSNIFLNPPSPQKDWWKALLAQREEGNIRHAVYLGYSMEIRQVSQQGCPQAVEDFVCCTPSKRLAFISPKGSVIKLKGKADQKITTPACDADGNIREGFGILTEDSLRTDNTHGSVIVYVPGTVNDPKAFYDAFHKIGTISRPYKPIDPTTPSKTPDLPSKAIGDSNWRNKVDTILNAPGFML